MSSKTVLPAKSLRGEIQVPGDKSVSHRSIMFGSIAEGVTTVKGLLRGDDNMSTMSAFKKMGINMEDNGSVIRIHGKGLHGLSEPDDVIDCGNSGTTIRLISGLLAGQNFFSVLTGDRYLRKRPMRRIVEPLERMGAHINGRDNGRLAPLAISGRKLTGAAYESPVSSAQVKSAVLLAGLYADGDTVVTEPSLSRDHSERMLKHFGAAINSQGTTVTISGGNSLKGQEIVVPGDISSAAFFIVAALIVPGSELLIKNVGINPTRTGIIDILTAMGGDIGILDPRDSTGEPVADLLVRSSSLKGARINGDLVPRAIDEFPAICIAAALAEGETVIQDARELRVKESDRISAMAGNLRMLGVDVEETPDGMIIRGSEKLNGGIVDSLGDHRIAMSLSIAGLAASTAVEIRDTGCVSTSFPDFYELLEKVAVR